MYKGRMFTNEMESLGQDTLTEDSVRMRWRGQKRVHKKVQRRLTKEVRNLILYKKRITTGVGRIS